MGPQVVTLIMFVLNEEKPLGQAGDPSHPRHPTLRPWPGPQILQQQLGRDRCQSPREGGRQTPQDCAQEP